MKIFIGEFAGMTITCDPKLTGIHDEYILDIDYNVCDEYHEYCQIGLNSHIFYSGELNQWCEVVLINEYIPDEYERIINLLESEKQLY